MAQTTRTANRTLWIILTVVWIAAGLGSAFLALMSVFMFDAPGSTSSRLTIALFFATVALPIFWFVGAVLPWIFRSKSYAKWLFLLPFVDVTAVVVIVAAISQFCSGNFSCQ
jgi:hypothetical protein